MSSARTIKHLSKRLVRDTLVRSGALRAAAKFAKPRAVILMYHSVAEDPRLTANSIGISQSRSSFEWQMRELVRHFHVVTIDDVLEFVTEGRSLPPRSVVVTFDDGFADNHEVAVPILARYGIPGTFYILVNAVDTGTPPWYCRMTFAVRSTRLPAWAHPKNGRQFQLSDPAERDAALAAAWEVGAALTGQAQDELVRQIESSLEVEPLDAKSCLMMNWDQVRALKKAGHRIGGHTLTHPNLAHVTLDEARSEIVGCKQALETKMNDAVEHFCYPHPALNPQWSQQTMQIAHEAGFRSAVLTTQGAVQPGDNPLALMRIPADEDNSYWLWQVQRSFLRDSA